MRSVTDQFVPFCSKSCVTVFRRNSGNLRLGPVPQFRYRELTAHLRERSRVSQMEINWKSSVGNCELEIENCSFVSKGYKLCYRSSLVIQFSSEFDFSKWISRWNIRKLTIRNSFKVENMEIQASSNGEMQLPINADPLSLTLAHRDTSRFAANVSHIHKSTVDARNPCIFGDGNTFSYLFLVSEILLVCAAPEGLGTEIISVVIDSS